MTSTTAKATAAEPVNGLTEDQSNDLIEQANIERDASVDIAKLHAINPKTYADIMSLSRQSGAQGIINAAKNKDFTCVEILQAFLRKAGHVNEKINAITELLNKEAIDQARELDRNHKSMKHLKLFGLPVSIKEHTGYNGKGCNAGFVYFLSAEPPTDPTHVNNVLQKQGAIIFARTIQPQTMMMLETQSRIYGQTDNPHNPEFSAGGSSGGEGALIGAGGSILGIGSDIGGSVRSPAANNGIYAFKPTAGMIGSQGGRKFGYKDKNGVTGTRGVLSSSRQGLALFMESCLPHQPQDISVRKVWDMKTVQDELSDRLKDAVKPIKIGIMDWDGVVVPHPPVLRALREVQEGLEHTSPGKFEIVDWKPQDRKLDHHRAWDCTHKLYWPDGGKSIKETLKKGNEKPFPLVEWQFEGINPEGLTDPEWEALITQRDTFRGKYKESWDEAELDAIICPVGPGTALPHNSAKYWSYTSVWNLLDYPAAVFPVTKANKTVDIWDNHTWAFDAKSKDAGQNDFNRRLYDNPAKYHGLPVALQIVTQRQEDEKCLALLEMIETELKKTANPQGMLAPIAAVTDASQNGGQKAK